VTGVRALAKVTMIALAGALEAQGAPDRVLSTARASHDSCATLAGGDLTPAVEKRRLEGWKDARRVSIGDWWIVLPTGATIDSTPRDTSEALVATELPYCEYCAVTVKLRRDSIGRGLDWILNVADGARADMREVPDAPEGRRVLEIRFEGANVDYRHAYQIVPIRGGAAYRLRAQVRAVGLTSLSGPRLLVEGYGACRMARVEGREWRGDAPWTGEELAFAPPAGCAAVVVRIRRPRTERFDARISGRGFVDAAEIIGAGDREA